jgi:hypothetical protein
MEMNDDPNVQGCRLDPQLAVRQLPAMQPGFPRYAEDDPKPISQAIAERWPILSDDARRCPVRGVW